MTRRKTKFTPGRGYTQADWNEVSDNPAWTADEIARARRLDDVLPALAAGIKRARGRPRADDPKEPVTLRISGKILERYKRKGGNWRARMVEAIEKGAGG